MRKVRTAIAGALAALVATPAQAASPPITAGTSEITRAEIDHWTRVAKVSARGPGIPPSARRPAELRASAVQFLVQGAWIEGEAALRGVVVTDKRVREEIAFVRGQIGARDPREWRKMLRELGMTREDIAYRTRLELLSTAIRKQMTAGVPDEDARAVLDRHVAEHTRRWRSATTCRRPFAVRAICGTVVD